MAGKIIYFKAEDFNHRGTFNQFYSECKLDDLVFRKSDTLNHHEIKQVLDICNKYNSRSVQKIPEMIKKKLKKALDAKFVCFCVLERCF